MKTNLKILVLSLISFLSVQTMCAQTISKAYSNSEIDALLKKYHSMHSRDAMPSTDIFHKFQADFPNARDVEWDVADNIYEVEFEIKLKDYKAFYDNKGNLLMYSHDINKSDLPKNIKNIAEKQYPKYRFEDIKMIHKGSDVFYKIEMERNDYDVTIILKNDGSPVLEWYE